MHPEKTALLLIGYQNDYFAERGVLRHMAESVTGFDTALNNTLHLLENIVSMPTLIVSTPIVFSPDYGELTHPVGALKIIKERGAFQHGTWGAETLPELRAFGERIMEVPGKLGLNAFSDTELDAVLRRRRIENLIIAGVLTSVCVDSTGRSAVGRGYRAIVLSDCTFGRTDFEQYFYCKRIFPLYAQVMDHRQLLQSTRSNHWQLVNEVSRMDDVEAEVRLHFLDELVATEERYRGLIERLSNIVFRYDDEGVLTYVNPAWQELLGYAPSESMDRSLMDFVYPEDRRIGWEELLHQASREPYRIRLFHHKGHVRWYELGLYADNRGGGVGLLYDITSQQENEDRSARATAGVEVATRSKDPFIAAMNHEVRTPVSTMVGMTNLLLQAQLGEKQRGQLEMIRDTGYFLLQVLDDILQFFRIETGELVLGICPMDPRMVIREALELSSARAEERGLELSVRVEPDVPELVVGDPECLRRILIRLVENAVKFTPQGRITIGLKVAAAQEGDQAEGDEWLEFAVQDTGIGIPAEHRGLLFQPFFQVEQPANSRKVPGAGLGLTIASRLVDLMGGTIAVESTPEVGSTFRFTLPMPLSMPDSDRPPEDGEQ